jgi:hypothetical protein
MCASFVLGPIVTHTRQVRHSRYLCLQVFNNNSGGYVPEEDPTVRK